MRRKKSKLASDDEENVAVNLPSVKVKIPCEVDTLVYGDVKPSLEENKEYLTELLFRYELQEMCFTYLMLSQIS